jgi:predicted hotdog family 3-hydroxylacyl-ACP dehydratase
MTQQQCPWQINRLLPHAAPKLLLDEVLSYGDDDVVVTTTPRPDHPFASSEGVPAHVGLELMAQACGAWASPHALANGEAIRLGFRLGTRRYKTVRPWFDIGQRLEISARLVFRDQNLGVFDCRISVNDEVLAEAHLSLYQPEDGAEPSMAGR